MSASIFSTLPPEIICQVFESADNFSVVAALAQTARIFYYTWRENPTSICRAVGPRVFSNLTDAERLLDMQEAAEAVSQSQDDDEQKSMVRAKRLLFNARCTSAASYHWAEVCEIHLFRDEEENPHMRPSEIERFEHAFYCVWTVGVMGMAPHLRDQASTFLDQCSPRELYRLEELRVWAMGFNENDFGSLGLDFKDEVWKVGCNLVSKGWDLKRWRLGVMPGKREAPLSFFAFFDHTQRYLDLIEDE